MFKLSENYSIKRDNLKCDYIRYSPSETSTISTANSEIYINIPREDRVISLLNSYLELNFDVLHAANKNRYVDGDSIRLVKLGPITLFSKDKLTTFSVKHLEIIEQGHIACLLYKLLTMARGCENLSTGFDHSRDRRQRELTNKKNNKGKHLVRICLKDIFGFAQHQLKGTYGLGYIVTLTGNKDSAVFNKDNAINNAKIKIRSLYWYTLHYRPSITQNILMNQIIKKMATELQLPEISIFMKEVNTQHLWNFELGTQQGINVPIWIFKGFQQMDRQHSQNLNNDTFYRPPVTSAHVAIGTERYPDNS